MPPSATPQRRPTTAAPPTTHQVPVPRRPASPSPHPRGPPVRHVDQRICARSTPAAAPVAVPRLAGPLNDAGVTTTDSTPPSAGWVEVALPHGQRPSSIYAPHPDLSVDDDDVDPARPLHRSTRIRPLTGGRSRPRPSSGEGPGAGVGWASVSGNDGITEIGSDEAGSEVEQWRSGSPAGRGAVARIRPVAIPRPTEAIERVDAPAPARPSRKTTAAVVSGSGVTTMAGTGARRSRCCRLPMAAVWRQRLDGLPLGCEDGPEPPGSAVR